MRRLQSALIVTFHRLDQQIGGPIASRRIINMFADIIPECHLIYPDSGLIESSLLRDHIQLLPCPDNRPKWVKGIEVYRGIIHRFHQSTIDFINRNKPDIVVFDTTVVSHRLIRFVKSKKILVVTIHHNVDRDYFKGNKPSPLIRLPFSFFIRQAEREAVELSDINLTFTEHDSQRLQKIYRSINTSGKFFCLGVYADTEEVRYFQSDGIKRLKGSTVRFIITGSLAFPQSEESIISFIQNYVPIIDKTIPSYHIIVAGSSPSERLKRKISFNSNISIIPDPEHLMPLILRSDVYLCPVDRGSGMKMRIMEGLQAGLPVLAHICSKRGYEGFIDKKIMFAYDSGKSFEDALANLLNSEFDSSQIQSHFKHVFSPKNGIEKLKDFITLID
jgi:glycosyltransferase involved in cell wall biosynthesis